MIVFETEVVTLVCLFPAIPSTATSVSDSVYDSNCGLGSDIDPRLLLVDEESDDDNGKDVLIDVATSLDTSHHDAQKFQYHAYPIPLATLQGHYNTVHLLPPANGPPTQPPKASSGSQRPFGLSANNQQLSSHLLEIAIEDDDPVPASTDVGDTPDPSPPDTNADNVILANVTKQKRTWTQPRGSDLPPSDIRKVLSNESTRKDTKADTAGRKEIVVDGTRYRVVNVARFYTVSSTHRTTASGSLIDRGANGGIAGER
jgi:hypothetical protein